LKPLSGKDMCKVLERHGWQLDRISGSHYVYKKPGRAHTIPVPVHGNKSLRPGTQRSILRSAGLTDDDL
jgi:predicted RNA binding protein YcfA (HicA-like mRNA interferase family)